MECHLERETRLVEESEYESLYKWSLKEFGSDSGDVSSAQVPWKWSMAFTASELSYHQEIETENQFGFISDDEGEGKKEHSPVNYTESISGALHSGWCTDGENLERDATFSLFGTGRSIKSFSLRIFKTDAKDEDDDGVERCMLSGFASFTSEIDFREEIEDDYIEVLIMLSPDRYNVLKDAIKNESPDVVQLRLGRVSGFYSDWSPEVSTSSVKILLRGDDQELAVPEGCDIEPPRLGGVGEFSIRMTQRHKLNLKQDFRSLDVDKLFEQDWEKDNWGGDIEDTSEKEPDSSSLLLVQLARNEQAISKLKNPLWLIFIAICWLLIIQ